MSTGRLPREFSDLEQWSGWSLSTEPERSARRQSSMMTEIRAFYDAMLPRIDEVLEYCNRFDVQALPPDALRLFELALSLAEVAPAIEQFQQASVVDGYGVERFQAQRLG